MKVKKLIYGVGNNDADYTVRKYEEIGCVNGKRKQRQVWVCPFYQVWKSMIDRCYSTKTQERSPTYQECTVATEWLTFSNFKNWMEKQQWEGNQLDKDLLIKGNKVYSEDTCLFVTQMVNSFTTDCRASRGEWMVGVSWYKPTEKFKSQCSNPFTKKNEGLGYFTTEIEAHEAWLKRKIKLAHELAEVQTDPRVAKALVDRYSIQ